jgi:Allene oxide cyclase barrel like domain
VFRGKLTDTSGQPAGTDGGYCVITKANRRNPVGECSATLFLQDGKITVSGGVNLRGNMLLPVVGGTGTYEGVQGTIRIQGRRDGRNDLTVNLHP